MLIVPLRFPHGELCPKSGHGRLLTAETVLFDTLTSLIPLHASVKAADVINSAHQNLGSRRLRTLVPLQTPKWLCGFFSAHAKAPR